MSEEITTAVRPLRDLLYVEKVRRTHYQEGGLIVVPATFRAGKHGHSARQKTAAMPDYFQARVLSVGPDVRELVPGDHVFVHTYADGDGSKLYTGENVGESERLVIKYPDDILCAIDAS